MPPARPELIGSDHQLALPGPVLDLTPALQVVKSPVVINKTIEETRLWQIARAKELWEKRDLVEGGMTKTRIAEEVGVALATLNDWIAHFDIRHTRGRIQADLRKNLKEQVIAYHDEHPNVSNLEMAGIFHVRAGLIGRLLAGRNKPGQHRMPDHKLGKHDQEIRRGLAVGRSVPDMAEAFGVHKTALYYYIRKHRLKLPRHRIEDVDPEIKQGIAEGKDAVEIARELHGFDHSTVSRRIRRLDLNTPAERKQNAARARAKKALQRKRLALDFGTELPQKPDERGVAQAKSPTKFETSVH